MFLPAYVRDALGRLADAGFEAYAVGGCVRDALMGREPSDYDVATSALPDEIAALFPAEAKVFAGIKHGTVGLVFGEKLCEVTAFRTDGSYGDGRRPDSVAFTRSLGDDLSRRDFTVNAMAYSERTGLVDPFGGRADISTRLLRTVGDPSRRFSEDGLRIMRLARFCACLGFEPEADTLRAASSLKAMLSRVARERITAEYLRMIVGADADRAFRLCAEILAFVLPGLYPRAPLSGAPESPAVRLALCGGADGLKLSRALNDKVKAILAAVPPRPDAVSVRKFVSRLPSCALPEVFDYFTAAGLPEAAQLSEIYAGIAARGDCVSIRSLAVRGDELPVYGRETGRMLEKMLDAVIEGRLENTKEELLTKGLKL